MRAIIELLGEAGVGKTTLACTLSDELSPAAILLIDATPDQHLTELIAPQTPPLTLAGLFARRREMTGTREAIDWAFHDLVVSAGEEIDLLAVGPLDASADEAERDKLRYGLTRLMKAYDYVIVDGRHPLIHELLPDEAYRAVTVLSPEQMNRWTPPGPDAPTAALILNQYDEQPLPAPLEEALVQGRVLLLGKLPRYRTTEDRVRRLPDDFQNCLLRLDIPLNLTSG